MIYEYPNAYNPTIWDLLLKCDISPATRYWVEGNLVGFPPSTEHMEHGNEKSVCDSKNRSTILQLYAPQINELIANDPTIAVATPWTSENDQQ